MIAQLPNISACEAPVFFSDHSSSANLPTNGSESKNGVVPGLSLAYIGTDSSTAHRVEHDHRSSRFRLGEKKEAAGVCRGRGPCRCPYIWNFNRFFLDRAALKFQGRRIQIDSPWLLQHTPIYRSRHYSPATALATAAPAASFWSPARQLLISKQRRTGGQFPMMTATRVLGLGRPGSILPVWTYDPGKRCQALLESLLGLDKPAQRLRPGDQRPRPAAYRWRSQREPTLRSPYATSQEQTVRVADAHRRGRNAPAAALHSGLGEVG